MKKDQYLHRAIELAQRGLGFASPNPLVGCVIVKNDQIIGEGWHQQFGGAHAEVNAGQAAEKAGHSVEGATVFVTLEPCTQHGKTPPCCDLLLEKKVAAVHILFSDPNPQVSGQAIERLKKAEIEVHEDYEELKKQHFDLCEDFFWHIEKKSPFTAIKMAQDANGFISEQGKQIRITGEQAQQHAHFLRQKYQSILVGATTVEIDDPHLGVRYGDFYQGRRDPLRVILDPHLRVERKRKVFRDENFLLVTMPENEQKALQIFGKCALKIPRLEKKEVFDLKILQKELYDRGMASVLIEGGKQTASEFLAQDCVQKGYFFVSPQERVEENEIRGVDWEGMEGWEVQRRVELGEDVLWEGRFYKI